MTPALARAGVLGPAGRRSDRAGTGAAPGSGAPASGPSVTAGVCVDGTLLPEPGALPLLVTPDGGLDLGTTGRLGVSPWRAATPEPS